MLRAAAVLHTDLRELRAQCCALMASAIELEIQERRTKKAWLDVEDRRRRAAPWGPTPTCTALEERLVSTESARAAAC